MTWLHRHGAPAGSTDLLPQAVRAIALPDLAGRDDELGDLTRSLEDMTRTPCQFPDTLHPLDADQMAQLVECFAHLHGTFFGRLPETSGGTGQFGWLMAPSEDPANPITPSVMKLSAKRLADRAPIGNGRFLWENCQAITEVVDSGPHTVLHGDAHPGNTFFRDGAAGLLDWQVVRRGHPARDLAYTMVLGMPTEQRRATQHDLLDTYRKALAAHGGPQFAAEELFTRYRQAVVHPYISALSTAGLGGMQDDDVALEGLRRAVAALEDLDTVDALSRAISAR